MLKGEAWVRLKLVIELPRQLEYPFRPSFRADSVWPTGLCAAAWLDRLSRQAQKHGPTCFAELRSWAGDYLATGSHITAPVAIPYWRRNPQHTERLCRRPGPGLAGNPVAAFRQGHLPDLP